VANTSSTIINDRELLLRSLCINEAYTYQIIIFDLSKNSSDWLLECERRGSLLVREICSVCARYHGAVTPCVTNLPDLFFVWFPRNVRSVCDNLDTSDAMFRVTDVFMPGKVELNRRITNTQP